MSRSRKHGIFSMKSEESLFSPSSNEEVRSEMPIRQALDTVYQQMRVAGNRIRTIKSYDYIFSQFVESTSLEFIGDMTVGQAVLRRKNRIVFPIFFL